ncbi:MAG TPA: BlaI/MecI/CopY family transcriptional regulator [Thermoanaerobaculia bacterium]|nr:BlaI/MecI/CopY family transcriptional regulator [Thermoanaerobaculia bacterium]
MTPPRAPHPSQLSRRERQIMDILFELDRRASVEDVRERLPDPPSYSAVRAMLGKLETKGFVRHEEESLRYVYLPTIAKGEARDSAVGRLVQVFFAGSVGQAVNALLDEAEELSDEELDRLASRIERARRRSDP